MPVRAMLISAALVLVAGCSNNPTSATSTTTTATSATQVFSGTIAPGDSPLNTFSLPAAQALHLTFASLTDAAGLPVNAPLTLVFGQQAAIDAPCSPLTSVTGPAALRAQINVTGSPGAFCVALTN